MNKRIIFVLLIVSVIGCAALKENFGTGEETPELQAARTECRTLGDKEAVAKYQNIIKQKDHARAAYQSCMEKKGYNNFGKKVN